MHQVPLRLDGHGRDVPGSHEPPAHTVVDISGDAVVSHLDFFMDASLRFPLHGHEVHGRDYALTLSTRVLNAAISGRDPINTVDRRDPSHHESRIFL